MSFGSKAHDRTCAVKFRLFRRLPTQPGQRGDFSTAEQASSCWIYLFQDRPGGSKVFSHEVYADENGIYYHVDLDKHHAKSDRPLAADPSDSIILSSAEMIGERRVCIGYWVLLSPFQLNWSRLPNMSPGRTLPANSSKSLHDGFVDWAKNERELEYLTFSKSEDSTGAVRHLWPTWQLPLAYQGPYTAARLELCKTVGENLEYLTVHQIVAGMIKREPKLAANINTGLFNQAGDALLRARTRAEECAKPVVKAFQSRPYRAMILDMWADATEDAHEVVIPLLADATRGLTDSKVGRVALHEFWQANQAFETLEIPAFKASRRAFKSIWELIRSVSEVVEQTKTSRQIFVPFAERMASWVFRVKLTPNQSGGFSRDSLDKLARRTKSSPWLTFLMTMLEAWNVKAAIEVARKNPVSLKTVVGAIGAASSLASAAKGLTEALTVNQQANLKALLTQMSTAGKSDIELLRAEQAYKARLLYKAGRVARQKLIGKVLGSISGGADMISGYYTAKEGYDVGDTSVTAGGIMIMAGGALMVAMALFPAGWLCLAALGQGLQLGGLLTAVLTKDDDLELWLRFCYWGIEAGSSTERTTTWSHGPLGELPKRPDRQLEALDDILNQMEVDGEFLRHDSMFQLIVRFRGFPREGHVNITVQATDIAGNVKELRKPGPWTNAVYETTPDSRYIVRMSEILDCPFVRKIMVTVQTDRSGDGLGLYPLEPVVRTFTS